MKRRAFITQVRNVEQRYFAPATTVLRVEIERKSFDEPTKWFEFCVTTTASLEDMANEFGAIAIALRREADR